MKNPFAKEMRPHTDPGTVTRGMNTRPDGDDKSVIMSDDIIPGRPCAIGTVSAVPPDDDWFSRIPRHTRTAAVELED